MMATYDSPTGDAPHQQYQQAQRFQQQQPAKREAAKVQYSGQPSASRPPAHQSHSSQASIDKRPKSRSFSFRSDKSGHSANNQKLIPESHAEKESKRLHSKADPTLAMNEVEPAMEAATAKVSLAPLREMTPRDAQGNAISEPDRSNPTRYRWERPLDTIRSFEAAIDGGYSNRKSSIYQQNDTESVSGGNTRRNSYLNSNNNGARYPQDAYYAPRPQSYVPSSYNQYELRPSRGNYGENDGYGNGYNNSYGTGYTGGNMDRNGRPRYGRMPSDAQYQQQYRRDENDVYPAVGGNQRSYETVVSGSGSGGEPAGYQTDPTSSDNSSIDRRNSPLKQPYPQQRRPDQQSNDYGVNFGQSNAYRPSYPGGPNGNGGRPSPMKLGSAPTVPTDPSGASQPPPPPPAKSSGAGMLRKTATQTSAAPDKRKSWFARKLSKRN